jgi:transcriptional repressor NrdR
MKCPYCGHMASKVIDSRTSDDGVRRRRECQACNERYTTYEQFQRSVVMVIKKDGRREEFQREKLLHGLRAAAQKRPLPTGAIDAIVESIEHRLMSSGWSEVRSRAIGEMVIKHLKALDPIAYIRFASVYRQFVSVEELLLELNQLSQTADVPPADQPRLFEDELSELVDGDDDLPAMPTPIELAPSVLARL